MGALGGKLQGDGAADAARATGDQRGPALQPTGHAITSPRSTVSVWPVMLPAASEARYR